MSNHHPCEPGIFGTQLATITLADYAADSSPQMPNPGSINDEGAQYVAHILNILTEPQYDE